MTLKGPYQSCFSITLHSLVTVKIGLAVQKSLMRFGSHFGALQHSTLPLPPKQPNTKKKCHFIPGAQVLCLCNLGCILVLFCSIKISGQSLSPK